MYVGSLLMLGRYKAKEISSYTRYRAVTKLNFLGVSS